MPIKVLQGDCIEQMLTLPDESVHCCVTSPPYFGLRSYLAKDDPAKSLEVGTEQTPEAYVQKMVSVFREVRRVLRSDGVLWLNLGDSYAGGGYANHKINGQEWYDSADLDKRRDRQQKLKKGCAECGIKPKDLIGIPHRVAFALQADGWYLRAICPWLKRNGMPESTRDRPTQVIEYIFLLTKSQKYFYDSEATKKPYSDSYSKDRRHETGPTDRNEKDGYDESLAQNPKKLHRLFNKPKGTGSLRRTSDWFFESQGLLQDDDGTPLAFVVNTAAYKKAHFATFPPKLIEPCILAGTSAYGCCDQCGAPWERVVVKTGHPVPSYNGSRFDFGKTAQRDGGDRTQQGERFLNETVGWQVTCKCNVGIEPCIVLDPFGGSGTTGQVAQQHGRNAVLIELNPAYIPLINERAA